MSRYCCVRCWKAPMFVLVLAWTVAGPGPPRASERADTDVKARAQQAEPDQTKVIRDEVPGSLLHGGGKTTWRRIIGQARVLDASTLEFADGTRIELDLAVPCPEQMAVIEGVLYPAGKEAADFLRKLVGDK